MNTEVCTKSPAHALVTALALLSEGSPVAVNLLGEYTLNLGTLIGHDRDLDPAWTPLGGPPSYQPVSPNRCPKGSY